MLIGIVTRRGKNIPRCDDLGPSKPDMNGQTLLHLATPEGHTVILVLLQPGLPQYGSKPSSYYLLFLSPCYKSSLFHFS